MKVYIVIFWNSDFTSTPEVKGAFTHKEDALRLAQKLFEEQDLDDDYIEECGDIDYEDGYYHIDDDDRTLHIEVVCENLI